MFYSNAEGSRKLTPAVLTQVTFFACTSQPLSRFNFRQSKINQTFVLVRFFFILEIKKLTSTCFELLIELQALIN